jgi:glycosyltransferase involved in cell wall biosynthesis
VQYGLVFQDLMGLAAEQSGVAGGARVAGLVRRVELRLARRASAVGIVADGFRRYLEAGGVPSERIWRLRNWTRRVEPVESAPETRRRFGWHEDEFVCVHGGNMGHKQGLDTLLDTADLLRDARVRVSLVGDGNDRTRLEQQARERGLSNVQFIELQGPGNWEATMQAADVLLVNQRASVTDMSLPSKLTSYFAAGRPVVAAASPDSETANEVESAGAGLVVPPSDPAAFRDAILALKDDQALFDRLAARGAEYARSTLSREAALAEYEAFLSAIVAGGRRN